MNPLIDATKLIPSPLPNPLIPYYRYNSLPHCIKLSFSLIFFVVNNILVLIVHKGCVMKVASNEASKEAWPTADMNFCYFFSERYLSRL